MLRYTNAGHNPPLLFAEGSDEPVHLTEGGVPVGMFAQAAYGEEEVKLSPDSLLAIYTDGFPEALNPHGEEFGDERFVEMCRDFRHETPKAFVERSLDSLRRWTGEAEQFDDMTLVVLRTAGEG